MARKPRPVNPAEGPLQAFAYDLRLVREQAGNPTYRVLAGLAGFSATTLSDAAGGMRQPSLEVTLAYVGACRGDVELWRKRWQELDRVLEEERAALKPAVEKPTAGEPGDRLVALPRSEAPVRGVGLPADDGVTPPADRDASAPGPDRRRWSQWPVIAAVAALAVAVGLLAMRLPALVDSAHPAATSSPSGAAAATQCPTFGRADAAFSGLTYGGGAHLMGGASLSASVLRQIPAGCTLEFTGYCLGDVATDLTAGGVPDMRWFELSGGGVVASAIIHGNPPASMKASPCPDDTPPASSISLSISPQGADYSAVDLRATGPHVWIVGYAAFFAANDGTSAAAQWHQLGLTGAAATGFALPWRLGTLAAATPGRAAIPVVAVACLGGDGPTGVLDALALDPAATAVPRHTSLGGGDLAVAERAACEYPSTG